MGSPFNTFYSLFKTFSSPVRAAVTSFRAMQFPISPFSCLSAQSCAFQLIEPTFTGKCRVNQALKIHHGPLNFLMTPLNFLMTPLYSLIAPLKTLQTPFVKVRKGDFSQNFRLDRVTTFVETGAIAPEFDTHPIDFDILPTERHCFSLKA